MSETPRWLHRTSLGTRIALPAGLFTFASVALLGFMMIREYRQQIQREVLRGSENIAEAILLSLDHDMRTNSREGIEELIAALGQHPDIEYIRLFNEKGEIAFTSGTDSAQSQVSSRRVIRNREGCDGTDCHKSAAEQPVLGQLHVALSMANEQEQLAATTRNALVTSLAAAVIITLVLFLIIRYSVRRPLQRMSALTRKIAEGGGGRFVADGGAREIANLSAAFNQMIESFGSSKQQLETLAHQLEQEVATEAEQLREAQYQVLQAEKLSSVGLVAAGIAHELNSPLMAIITFSHLVRSTLPADSRAQEDLRMIEREANRCAAIIRQLLDYSRKQTQEPATAPYSVEEIIEGALALLKVEQKNIGVDVHMEIAADLPEVEVNDLQLMQVFMNLMLNALQAMPHGGDLTITASRVARRVYEHLELPAHKSPDLVRITVRDTGCGIARENRGRVFDPFFTTKPVGKGSGLGLSVSLGLVRRFHGTMLVDSDGASWTEFTVLLPACQQPALVGV